ncbi:MAG TPA: methyltransferase domain-containing protein [Stellaceae bacterium]|nr:methyltransferase domain-containing protein [Stellaceae bacterium]
MYEYAPDFYSYLAPLALRSADRVVPHLAAALPIASVADFGCGQGAWLRVWRATGAAVLGVDGPYVDRSRLLIEAGEFRAADLGERIDLGRRFDLVQSLEVAEHLPQAKAQQFIDTLCRHSACILFSAAVPGQGGEQHVNEQPLSYWRALFRDNGYAAVDYLRPLVFADREIQWWYRYNTILYVTDEKLAALREPFRAARIAEDESLPDYYPLPHRVRNAIVRRLPEAAASRLARIKSAAAARRGGYRLGARG